MQFRVSAHGHSKGSGSNATFAHLEPSPQFAFLSSLLKAVEVAGRYRVILRARQ